MISSCGISNAVFDLSMYKLFVILITFNLQSLALAQYLKSYQLDLLQIINKDKKIFSNGDLCVLPDKYKSEFYSDKDLKTESTLCSIDLENNSVHQAVCGKIVNTNPGFDIFNFNDKIDRLMFEKQECYRHSNAENFETKKIAKLKQTITCSYTPSILAYYHVSRLLGDIGNVPVAVLRTSSKQYLLNKANETIKFLKTQPKSTIQLTWPTLVKSLNDNTSKRNKYLMTSDARFAFGAIVANPTNEEYWTDYSHDAQGDQMLRAAEFKKTGLYKMLIDSRDVASFIIREYSQENLQKIYELSDFSDMIVIDTLLKQEDRYNNIAFELDTYKAHELPVQKLSKKEQKEILSQNPQTEFWKIKRLVLKDNDCGVASEDDIARTNINIKTKISADLAHMKESTYKALLTLAQELNLKDRKLEVFLKENTLMTDKDFAAFKKTTLEYSKYLHDRCLSGALKLDLAPKTFFNETQSSWSCEL